MTSAISPSEKPAPFTARRSASLTALLDDGSGEFQGRIGFGVFGGSLARRDNRGLVVMLSAIAPAQEKPKLPVAEMSEINGARFRVDIPENWNGGLITYDVIERFPDSYDGALPMGGTAEPKLEFMKSRMFDLRLLFDHFIPGLSGSVVEFPQSLSHSGIMAQAKELMKQKPEETKMLLRIFGIRNEEGMARTLATYTLVLRDVYNSAKGNAFDNRNTYYKGSDDDLKLNREIKRYQGDPKAVEHVRQLSAPSGRITKPVLALNPHGDPVVPIENTHYYDTATQRAGASHLFAQMWVEAPWASYKPEEIRRALELLAEWIKHGKRPTPGELKINEVTFRDNKGEAK